MADAQLQQFLEKVRQLNAFVALTEAHSELRDVLRNCNEHHEVVALARACGFEIGRRWGEPETSSVEGDNLLAAPCPRPGTETFTSIIQSDRWRLVRIHSCSARSPEGFWYDQVEHEWLTVLQGTAELEFDDPPGTITLNRGDSLLISPRRRHRVVATDPSPGTVWLALFWHEV